MRIALGQIDMGFENKEKAMELCSQLMAEAKEKAVDLVIDGFKVLNDHNRADIHFLIVKIFYSFYNQYHTLNKEQLNF